VSKFFGTSLPPQNMVVLNIQPYILIAIVEIFSTEERSFDFEVI
jgi:hypothetical protein